jgi:2-C-methyl-D-erythritol 2,4-cyclodiphosphate synthase
MRIGLGVDYHRFEVGRPLILGGVTIPYDKGLIGHSDADVLTHAIMDALLGALALGDIGKHFPDTSDAYKDADSMLLLGDVYKRIKSEGYILGNIDSVVVAQEPKLAPHIALIQQSIANTLLCDISQISVKATTSERMGPEGRIEGMSSRAVALLLPL